MSLHFPLTVRYVITDITKIYSTLIFGRLDLHVNDVILYSLVGTMHTSQTLCGGGARLKPSPQRLCNKLPTGAISLVNRRYMGSVCERRGFLFMEKNMPVRLPAKQVVRCCEGVLKELDRNDIRTPWFINISNSRVQT